MTKDEVDGPAVEDENGDMNVDVESTGERKHPEDLDSGDQDDRVLTHFDASHSQYNLEQNMDDLNLEEDSSFVELASHVPNDAIETGEESQTVDLDLADFVEGIPD
eukprot:scaffold4060_cov190-Amphora_coffeaeformis.AAC.5